jgi:acetyl esterase/lipase
MTLPQDDDAGGYRRPPKQTRWKKRQSGSPKRRYPARSKGRTTVRIYRPESAKGGLPVVIYILGGGWVLGDRETHDRLVRELTVGANAVVVFVDYDLGDAEHYPFNPPVVSDKITVTIK